MNAEYCLARLSAGSGGAGAGTVAPPAGSGGVASLFGTGPPAALPGASRLYSTAAPGDYMDVGQMLVSAVCGCAGACYVNCLSDAKSPSYFSHPFYLSAPCVHVCVRMFACDCTARVISLCMGVSACVCTWT